MRKKVLVVSLIVMGMFLYISAVSVRALSREEKRMSVKTHLAFESDNPDKLLLYKGFVVKFSKKHKVPLWSYHKQTFNQIRENDEMKKAKRPARFKIDKSNVDRIPVNRQARHEAYSNTGLDRGHMTPAADFTWDQELKNETFYITNITPQTPDFNQIVCRELEEQVRQLVKEAKKDHYIITGAIYASKNARGISKLRIGIPSSFYKVVFDGEKRLRCYLIPHQFAYPNFNLNDYRVSLDKIEELAGEDFFDKLPDEVENKLESKVMDIESELLPAIIVKFSKAFHIDSIGAFLKMCRKLSTIFM